MNNIKKKIAVLSGKGGVGKFFGTTLLFIMMNKKGYNIERLDVNIIEKVLNK